MNWEELKPSFKGEIYTDALMRTLYATDASVYKEMPEAVAFPRNEEDVILLVKHCIQNKISIIPRTAGTSLAGQCVGKGLVVDVSKYMNQILEFDSQNGIIKAQPGVIRDELNRFVKPYGWFFGPNTSTANRCMIGGMTGNNSCGSTSIKYGNTRDKVLKIKAVMADAQALEFSAKEGDYNAYEQELIEILNPKDVREEIENHFPKKSIKRRNTGYAVDIIADMKPFNPDGELFNAAKLLCGSEGTLAFSTEITLQLDPLPPVAEAIVAAHFNSIRECMEATRLAMTFEPYACELMDKIILDCTKENLEQKENRFFVEGDPAAILAIELRADTQENVLSIANNLIHLLKESGKGYAFPILLEEDIPKVWNLRAAGLGLLSNIPGPKKALACIEDTAVALEDLPNYISEFEDIMKAHKQDAVYYAHAGAGEIHLRPILNLRSDEGLQQFRQISTASAQLVKKYQGSLSGEHGDGRVRAEFIPMMVGEKNYQLLRRVKHLFDPINLFNPGKIVDAPPMDSSLREDPEHPLKKIDTFFDYSAQNGFLAAVEKCNGSGDCRKPHSTGGTMCPSYQATLDEKHTTRGRANALREFISQSSESKNAFDHPELKEVLSMCLSCKGCTRECPSNVDMASMKSEWQHQYYKTHGVPLRTRFFGQIELVSSLASKMSLLANLPNKSKWLGKPFKKMLGIAQERALPEFASESVHSWYLKNKPNDVVNPKGKLFLFLDEFTDYQDVEVGKKALLLLWRLGYQVHWQKHAGSARAMISKGLLPEARKQADKNVLMFESLCNEDFPLVGIEPYAILGFRDEYPRLVSDSLKPKAKKLSKFTFLLDEFLASEIKKGTIKKEDFKSVGGKVKLHGHCHQKALSSLRFTKEVLKTAGFEVEIIPSGCCGMAGSFGYEAENYSLSMKIGEMVLFPAIRNTPSEVQIIAPGTSCRHQIFDGTGRKAKHWVELF